VGLKHTELVEAEYPVVVAGATVKDLAAIVEADDCGLKASEESAVT